MYVIGDHASHLKPVPNLSSQRCIDQPTRSNLLNVFCSRHLMLVVHKPGNDASCNDSSFVVVDHNLFSKLVQLRRYSTTSIIGVYRNVNSVVPVAFWVMVSDLSLPTTSPMAC